MTNKILVASIIAGLAAIMAVSVGIAHAGTSSCVVNTVETFPYWNGAAYVIDGTSGDDDINCGNSAWPLLIINGGRGDDIIYGSPYDDVIHGSYGNDELYGGAGNDTLLGGYDGDSLNGGFGSDLLLGGKGSDYLFCGGTDVDGDPDTALGGQGNDLGFCGPEDVVDLGKDN